jgi:hypothetical protein
VVSQKLVLSITLLHKIAAFDKPDSAFNSSKKKMKKINSLILLLLFTSIAFAQVSKESEKAIIKNLVQESFDEIWSKLDAKNITKYYTMDFLLLENGEVWNNDSIANYLNKAILRQPSSKRENTIEIIEIKISNNRAWIAYQNYATFSTDNKISRKAQWLESATAILTANGWKLDMLHSTRIKNELNKN